jgi:hypothetical protein
LCEIVKEVLMEGEIESFAPLYVFFFCSHETC